MLITSYDNQQLYCCYLFNRGQSTNSVIFINIIIIIIIIIIFIIIIN